MDEMNPLEADLPPYPIQNWFTQPIRQAAGLAGRPEYMALWAGQAAALSQRRSALDIFNSLVQETEQILGQIHSFDLQPIHS